MQREMNVLEIIQALIKRLKVLIIIVLVFGVLGGGVSFLLADEVYESTASLIVGAETQKETDEFNQISGEPIYEEVIEYGNSSISDQSKKFYSETLNRQDLLDEVINNLELDLTTEELRRDIKIETPENSSSLYITVESAEIQEVDLIVNNLTEVFIEKVYEITEVDKIKILNTGSKPITVSNRNLTRNLLISVVLGLVVSFVLILILEYLDDSIKSEKDIENKLKLPIIGILEKQETLNENIKQIRTQLEYGTHLKDKKVILLAGPNQDYQDITIDLSKVLGANGNEVLLIDADFRNPEIHNDLGLSNELGLSNLLESELEIKDALHEDTLNVQILTTGDSLENPSEKLSTIKMKELLGDLRASFDYVLIKGHSINEVTDSVALSTATDGIILLVKENKTKQSEIERIQKILVDINVEILGVIYSKI